MLDDLTQGAASLWTLIVPLKPLAHAKSRLVTTPEPRRPALALAFALDTVSAALSCPEVGRVLVVTDDQRASTELGALGADIIPDRPARGLNAALAHGAEAARATAPWPPVAALNADLPALRAVELSRVLNAAAHAPRSFLADALGTGTTMLTARSGVALRPAFGGGSRGKHLATGAREITLADVDSVRQDVDTREDLLAALTLGVGRHTLRTSEASPR